MKGTTALVTITTLILTAGCAAGPAPAVATSPVAAHRADAPVAVPPVPVVDRVRYAAHDGYDRIVLDIPGTLPAYTIKYVSEVREDGSDRPVSLPGKAFLLIVLHPAQAHRADGTPTVTGVHQIGLPVIKGYARVGDYEGYVSIALGLAGRCEYQVGTLSNRIYVDVTAP